MTITKGHIQRKNEKPSQYTAHSSSRSGYQPPLQDRAGLDYSGNFGAPHPSGFQVVLCDGSIRSMSNAISEQIHRCLCNRKDRRGIDASQF